ncbi:AIM24 family protein [filamentous cyanobacterium LEGE 11480]|uniref:AIM24 family protein n=1 Tax=Romeriopsis navalis LEGE 11480 TaxID=2777977 RepID=A0A928VSR7_9CYAN|nr:AIM24 family protein [Romeriopsis navalis]MBE9033068.1 AIM24 family protein [Romeriopsis navalis LEGE 11480]
MNVAWYYRHAEQEMGPVSPKDLVTAVNQGIIQPETPVRQAEGEWMSAGRVQGLFKQPSPKRKPSQAAAEPSQASNLTVIDAAERHNFKIEIIAHKKLLAGNNLANTTAIYYANEIGLQLKQIKITLKNSAARLEAGALQYLYGDIQISNKTGGVSGIGKAMLKSFVTNEATFRPRYEGTGEIYVNQSFGHYLIYDLDGEDIIADKGIYVCSEGSIEVGVAMQKNLSAGIAGGEGWFQTKVSGKGLCVFNFPVPPADIRCIELNNETLRVDGNFAIMRTGGVNFSVETATNSLVGTVTSGEGLLQTFRGKGKVWLAPTLGSY